MSKLRTIRTPRPRLKLLQAGSRRPGPPSPTLKGLALLLTVLLLALAGCVPAPDSIANQLVEAINAQNLDTALSLFGNNAVVSVDGTAPFSDKHEIQAWLEGLIADNLKLSQSEILNRDENSFRARYSLTMTSANDLGVASLDGIGEITTQLGGIKTLYFSLGQASRAKILSATLHSGAPVLSYAVLTDPNPLRASPGGRYDPNIAALTVAITNDSGEPVQVRSISLRLPEGPNASDLTPNISGVNSASPDRWNITKKEGRFIIAPELPEDGLLATGQGLSITLSQIEINDQPGAWGLQIVEETGESATGNLMIQMVKSPFTLYVSDLAADPLVVKPGETTTLFWEGSDGATYRLYNGREFVPVDSVDSYQVDNLTQTTTFYLTATLVGAEDPQVIRERTVTVSSP